VLEADLQSEAPDRFKRPESILVVIYTRQGHTLLLKRNAHRTFWQSVTGGIHWSGETAREAAIRELKEECGICAQASDMQDWKRRFRFVIPSEVRHRYGPNVDMNVEHMFSIRLQDKVQVRLEPREHSAYQWVDFDQAESMVYSWSNREAIRMIRGT